jgi:hypothetical protein
MHIGFIGEPLEGTWTFSYFHNVVSELLKLGHQVSVFPAEKPDHLTCLPVDFWLMMGDTDYGYKKWLDFAESRHEPVFAHHHGGPELFGFYDWPQQKEFYEEFGRDLDRERFAGIFFNTAHSLRSFWMFYHSCNMDTMHVIGFPVDEKKFSKPCASSKELIVVSGRLANDRLPMVAMQILAPFKDVVVFAAGYNTPIHNSNGPEHEYLNTITQAGFCVKYLQGESYYTLMRRARVIFNASMRDTLNTSVVEGIMAGAVPVVPNMLPFSEYLSEEYMYPQYVIGDAQRKVSDAYSGKYECPSNSVENFRSSVVVRNMVDIIKTQLHKTS